MSQPLRICLIASSQFPVSKPFMGGLEAHTHALASSLIRAGHDVSLFAAPGSDPELSVTALPLAPFSISDAARRDVSRTSESWMREHHAYLELMLSLARGRYGRFDVVHNNSLHHLPVAMSSFIEAPVVTTLHTPPLAWLESAAQFASDSCQFVAVSDSVAQSWRHVVTSVTVPSGIDSGFWEPGPGGGNALWFGRLVPEKAPHDALLAAHAAGRNLELAGPVHDEEYFREQVQPLMSAHDRYLGHLSDEELRRSVGRAEVVVVTPGWDEPFGLVAAEAMSCGTPVAAFDRGAMREVVGEASGVLAPAGDIRLLARAIDEAALLDRNAVRQHAVEHFSLDRMVEAYLSIYTQLAGVADVA
jgi:glycosyltransferase involved in cell wall biosynthesis